MNIRKFLLIFNMIISVFLFFSGIFILKAINANKNVQDKGYGYFDNIIKPFRIDGNAFNILVMGGDKVNNNSDTMLLVNYNPSDSKVSILSIPRDTKVWMENTGTAKINSAYPTGGAKLAVSTVRRLLNVNIKYYIFIDIVAFKEIIDELGGVDYYVPVKMKYDDPVQNLHIDIEKGMQHLDGEKAQQFMRFRQPNVYTNEVMKLYNGSDLKRIDAQQNFLKEIIKQKINIYSLIKLDKIINILKKNTETNISFDEALKLSQNIIQLKSSDLTMLKLPGEDSNEYTGWYYICDKGKTEGIIQKYFSSRGNDSEFEENKKNQTYEKQKKQKKVQNNNTDNNYLNKNNPSGISENTINNNPSNSETSLAGTTKDRP